MRISLHMASTLSQSDTMRASAIVHLQTDYFDLRLSYLTAHPLMDIY